MSKYEEKDLFIDPDKIISLGDLIPSDCNIKTLLKNINKYKKEKILLVSCDLHYFYSFDKVVKNIEEKLKEDIYWISKKIEAVIVDSAIPDEKEEESDELCQCS